MPGEDGQYREGLGFALWALWIAGLAGIHRIYLGKYGTGILYLLTFGLFGVGQIVDLFRMKTLVREANIREGYLPHPRVASYLAESQRVPAVAPAKPLRQRLLESAIAHGGAISVTQGVADTGATFEEVEAALLELLGTGYVDVDNAPGTGVVIYRFTELS
ncbi:MAG: TM2 domain-containing protein [Gemmatimonadota bacterium]